jgi:hypothetical protein
MPNERKAPASPAFSSALAAGLPEHIRRGIEIAAREHPDLGPIEPYGPISRALMPANVEAYVSPGRTIYINPAMMAGYSPEDVADTLAHEQTHVRQARDRGQGSFMTALRLMFGGPEDPYHRRPDELAAYQAEAQRRARMGRPQTSRPSFMTGEFYTPTDVNLRVEKKR